MRAGDQQTGAGDTAKWQSFSIRSVLGDALHDDDEEDELDVVVDAGGRLDGTDRGTMPPGDGIFRADLSPGAASSCSNSGAGDDAASQDGHQDENVQETSESSLLRCTDELHHFSRWPAFQAVSNVIITSAQHPAAALNNRYSNHGTVSLYRHIRN